MRIAFKVGQLVEMTDPSFQIQRRQGTIVMDKRYMGCTLASRQFGRLVRRNGGYYYVRPIIGKRLARPTHWVEEYYENELRHVNPRLNPYDGKIRKFKRKKK